MQLEELLLDYTLPQVVLCKTPVLHSHSNGPLPINLDLPILLADQRTARHLLARIVNYDDRKNTFYESTDSVVIPEDYEGNFLRLQSRTTKDKSQVQSLDTIAHDDTPAFLNLSDMTSFPAGRSPRDHSKFIYTVGNVFLVDEPLPTADDGDNGSGQDLAPQSAVSAGSSKRSGNGLMRCLDERGMVIMVPTNQVGEMVKIQKGPDGSSKLSVKSSEMIASEKFPLLTRFAYSKRRPRLTGFSRLFTLLDSFQETSIVACVLDGGAITLLEIPVASSLQFQVALNRDELLNHPRVRKALDVCTGSRGQEFVRDIKYKYKFSHRVQETSRRMMKLKEDDLPSATVRTRLVVTETYVYI
nr:hypothetical protein BaRGS_020298 [Batillaria attramentaria]